jgi:hypothetical protein
MNTRLGGTGGKCRQPTATTARNRRSRLGQDASTAPVPVAVNWAGAQLRRQIQQAGAALAPPPSPPAGRAQARTLTADR